MVIIALITALVLIGVDQAIKQWALDTLAQVDTIPLIQDVLHLTYVENYGAAFSILQNKKWFLIGVTSLIAIGAIVLLLSKKLKSNLAIWSVALIIAGGVGNLIDRIGRGFVVDYVDFRLINFAVFNFADCCVVVGTILLAIYILYFEGKDKHLAKEKNI
ncbi:signal peptidase II [Hydrogenoanaerobacterium saccharovorans]|uniref:Lipoprotein signal peptidase n=1 Tax=Hydrogenoanaerobacterium saccharovorans TaxID=474960 RepID=A0A1H7ZIV5_9FIRM|nr:signal peptidase II [Hydrogenoanaerobacterium saccharovorans]RPF48558.1 signal peptidase II [Hydrogenoanaerobacterium saccharovorans]SEM58512.1 signal peptidase II [Hydrogenoanaerobacterium saccharovorans]